MKNGFRILSAICLMSLLLALAMGIMAGHHYTSPGILGNIIGFEQLRPLHTGFVFGWVIFGGMTVSFFALKHGNENSPKPRQNTLRAIIMISALVLMATSYIFKQFGGREYWEFPPLMAAPWLLMGIVQLISFRSLAQNLKGAPVYKWMWFTGSLMFVLIMLENYAWLFPGVFNDPVKDMTLQWKTAGALVGAWNQLIYGTSLWLMCRLGNSDEPANSRSARLLFILGFTNLLFNWGHHIYTLPTQPWVRYVSYIVSMTEWIILLKIIRDWMKSAGSDFIRSSWAGKFMLAADRWIFANLFLALLISIPAINKFTHGTHITAAHAMGSTIGINTMILLAVFIYLSKTRSTVGNRSLKTAFLVMQVSFAIFWLSMLVLGMIRGMWHQEPGTMGFASMMERSAWAFEVFFWSGSILAISFIPFVRVILQKPVNSEV